MKAWRLGLPLGVVLLAARAAADEKSYVLAGDRLPPAGVVTVMDSSEETAESAVHVVSEKGEQNGTKKYQATTRVTRTFEGPDRVISEMSDATEESRMILDGREVPSPVKPKLLLKVPILAVRKDGQWTRTLADGKPLSEEQMKELNPNAKGKEGRLALTEKTIYGEGPHKIGDKWDVDVSQLPPRWGLSKITGSMSCELVETKMVQGLLAAVIKMTFDYTEEGTSDGTPSKVHMKGEATAVRCTDFPLELERTIEELLEWEYHFPKGVVMTVSGPMSLRSSTTVKMP